jgi:hypothetical protein
MTGELLLEMELHPKVKRLRTKIADKPISLKRQLRLSPITLPPFVICPSFRDAAEKIVKVGMGKL